MAKSSVNEMPTMQELFGDSSGDENGDAEIDLEELEEDLWEEGESDLELELAQGQHDDEEAQRAEQERQEKEREIEEWRRSVVSQYQKHPPREKGLERKINDREIDYCDYLFCQTYPDLFNVALTRVQSLLGGMNGRYVELSDRRDQLKKMPCSAEACCDDVTDIDNRRLRHFGWTTQLQTILKGTRSRPMAKKMKTDKTTLVRSVEQSTVMVPLTLLRDYEDSIIREIFSFLPNEFGRHITMTIPADVVMNLHGWRMGRQGLLGSLIGSALSTEVTSDNRNGTGYVAFARVGQVLDLFPPPKGRNVNMMPFILGDQESLPDDLRDYYSLIDACPFLHDDFGKIAFLTVHESDNVDKGKTQRRPGLHIESPGLFAEYKSNGESASSCSFTPGEEMHHWGRGSFGGPDRYEGGIYLASTVDDSTALWDGLVDSSVPGITNRQGGIDHLKPFLPDWAATKLRAGELVWLTDCTPHEALPQTTGGPRSFFRLVMSDVTHWYAAHSTPNPKVPLPANVKVIEDSKFATALKAGSWESVQGTTKRGMAKAPH